MDKKFSIITPEFAVRFVWAKTILVSSNEHLKTSLQTLNKQLDSLLEFSSTPQINNEKKVLVKEIDDFIKNTKKDEKKAKEQITKKMDNLLTKAFENIKVNKEDIQFINEVNAAIGAAFRNLVMARNGLDVNWTEVGQIRKQKAADIENMKSLTKNFGSIVPRLAGITIGAAGTASLKEILAPLLQDSLKNIFPADIEIYSLPLTIVVGAILGYAIYSYILVPRFAKQKERELIETEYDRIMYIRHYLNKVRRALKTLYRTVEKLAIEMQGINFQQVSDEDIDVFINEVLAGADFRDFMCKYVEECKEERNLNLDRWVLCETNKINEGCKIFKEKDERKQKL